MRLTAKPCHLDALPVKGAQLTPRIVTRPLTRPQTDQRFKGEHVAGEARQVRLHKGRAAAQAAHAATAAYRGFKG